MTTRVFVDIKFLRGCEKLPQYATQGSAAVDLVAAIPEGIALIPGKEAILVGTGIALDFSRNPDMVCLVAPRSGAGHKGFCLGNTIGVIDSDYQGEIMISCVARGPDPFWIMPGDRIAQMFFVPVIRAIFGVVDEFQSATLRGAGGFGSTGKT